VNRPRNPVYVIGCAANGRRTNLEKNIDMNGRKDKAGGKRGHKTAENLDRRRSELGTAKLQPLG